MKIYGKIVLTTMPLVLFSLIAAVGISYYFSYHALRNLAETWLSTRLSEAVKAAQEQETILQRYGLEKILASVAKAKSDAGITMSSINIGEKGYIFVVDAGGHIVVHPDRSLIGTDLSGEDWFDKIAGDRKGQIVFHYQGVGYLAMYDHYRPWGWTLFATDPESEVYSMIDRMKPYTLFLGIATLITVALVLMFLTRRLTAPLKALTTGAERIGKGHLDTRILLQSKDELGRLATVFNSMTVQLEETLTALSRKEKYFRSLIENATDIITILDRHGIIVYKSPSVEKILGYSPEALINKNFLDFVHPDDRNRFKIFFKEIRRNSGITGPTEIRFRHQFGAWKTLEFMSINLLQDSVVSGVVFNSRDISKRKAAELALRHTEQKYRGIFENAIEGIYQTTLNGRLIAVNPSFCRITGYESPEELLSSNNKHVQRFYVNSDDYRKFLQMLKKSGWLSGFETQIYRKDRSKIWVIISARISHDACGKVVYHEGSLLDITEKKRAEVALQNAHDELERRIIERTAELAQVNVNLKAEVEERRQAETQIKISLNEKEVLLSEVHHRVKNNLQIIASLLDMSKRQAHQPETIEFLSMAHARILSMALIHTQLYRSDRFDEINMGIYCQNLFDHLRYLYSSANQIETFLRGGNVHLSVNQAIPCALALNELITNAYKHAFENCGTGKIIITIEQIEDNTISIQVKDDGCGIPEDLNIGSVGTLGFKLIRNLIEKQLNGKLQIERIHGTVVQIEFQKKGVGRRAPDH